FRFLCSATPSTLIYTLSLHDALPIYEDEHQKCDRKGDVFGPHEVRVEGRVEGKVEWNLPRGDDGERSWVDRGNHLVDIPLRRPGDRKSTRLNSSHLVSSYAVFCLKKK